MVIIGVIRYHVIRAEAETCYGYLGIENKNTKKIFVFCEGLGEYVQDRHWLISSFFNHQAVRNLVTLWE